MPIASWQRESTVGPVRVKTSTITDCYPARQPVRAPNGSGGFGLNRRPRASGGRIYWKEVAAPLFFAGLMHDRLEPVGQPDTPPWTGNLSVFIHCDAESLQALRRLEAWPLNAAVPAEADGG